MELKLRLQSFAFIATILLALLCINWYSNIGVEREYTEIKKTKLTKAERISKLANPNIDKDFYWEKKQYFIGKNTMVPFIVDKKLIEDTPLRIISE